MKHVVMLFRFGGIRQAYNFQDALIGLGVTAGASYNPACGWYVKTDSRCLEHAAELNKLIYKAKAARA